MEKFWRFRRPLIIVVGVSIADLAGRFALQFQMKRVTLFEALLFAFAAILLIWPRHHKGSAIESWLAVVFGLGSLRATLWAGGLRVGLANLVVLGVFLLALLGYAIRRWVYGRRTAV